MPNYNTAYVVIRNKTGKTINNLVLEHKYSNIYFNNYLVEELRSNEESETMYVEYNTGFLTTGVDWWKLSWDFADRSERFFSSPNNFRGFFDCTERLTVSTLGCMVTTGHSLEKHSEHLRAREIPKGQYEEDRKLISKVCPVNNESTVGFKKHTLRSEDAGKITYITIESFPTCQIEFKSESGISRTVTASKYEYRSNFLLRNDKEESSNAYYKI